MDARRGVSWPRVWSGAAVAAASLTGLTVLLVRHRGGISLASVALLFLVPVVLAAATGGLWPALGAAVAADLAVNFYFMPPFHTLVVQRPDHLIVLVIYVAVATTVSVAVEVAARQRERASRRASEAALLARITNEPMSEHSLSNLLDQVRRTFAMTAVALLESDATGEHKVATVGQPPEGRPALSAPAGDGLRLVAWGPEIFAEDRRILLRLATATGRALQMRRLADEAARAEQLAQTDRVRAALLAAVGHDLRTPLAAIKAAASGLHHSDIPLRADEQGELLDTIEESSDRLSDLVDNLLSMSRLQAGMVSVRLEDVALDGVVAQALLHAPAEGAGFEVDIADDLPLIHADPGLLERIVGNLAANARAASPPDEPIVLRGHADDEHVYLEVIDHGRGVRPVDRDRMFAPFQRLDDRGTSGLGLGLAIARGFAEAMDAAISPTETPGGGLTMTLTLPRAAVPTKGPTP